MADDRKSYPSDVCDEEWAFVAPYLTLLPEDAGQRDHSLREVFNGLRYIVKTGAPWRWMPNDLPPWSCVYQQARRWLAWGCFEALVDDLRAVLRMANGRAAEPSAAILDSRTLRSTPESGERAGYDGAKRKKGSKLHAAVDTLAICWRSTSPRPASETMLTIAADPRHLGARIGITAVLYTWGSALTHHPHVHMIVPGGGISLDGTRWVPSRPAFLLPVHVLGKLFRRLFLTGLTALHAAGRLRFFGDRTGLNDPQVFERHLAPMKAKKWVVYAKPPFGGPEAVLAYLSRYTHRVAISNQRLIAMDEDGVTFRYM